MSTSLLDTPRSIEPEPITLRAKHDFSLTTTALEEHEVGLRVLAKKTRDGGYPREARSIEADADAIKEYLLPAFRQQRELPLVTQDELKERVRTALSLFVRQAFAGLADENVKITPSGIELRRDTLLRNLSERVTLYAADVAYRGYSQGFAARSHSPEMLALQEIDTLGAGG